MWFNTFRLNLNSSISGPWSRNNDYFSNRDPRYSTNLPERRNVSGGKRRPEITKISLKRVNFLNALLPLDQVTQLATRSNLHGFIRLHSDASVKMVSLSSTVFLKRFFFSKNEWKWTSSYTYSLCRSTSTEFP